MDDLCRLRPSPSDILVNGTKKVWGLSRPPGSQARVAPCWNPPQRASASREVTSSGSGPTSLDGIPNCGGRRSACCLCAYRALRLFSMYSVRRCQSCCTLWCARVAAHQSRRAVLITVCFRGAVFFCVCLFYTLVFFGLTIGSGAWWRNCAQNLHLRILEPGLTVSPSRPSLRPDIGAVTHDECLGRSLLCHSRRVSRSLRHSCSVQAMGSEGQTIEVGLCSGPEDEYVRHVHLQHRKKVQHVGSLSGKRSRAERRSGQCGDHKTTNKRRNSRRWCCRAETIR